MALLDAMVASLFLLRLKSRMEKSRLEAFSEGALSDLKPLLPVFLSFIYLGIGGNNR